MNWNMQTPQFNLRLPITDQDGDALFDLLKDPRVSAHIPAVPLYAEVQGLDELRRATLQFQAREAATWLLERQGDGVVLARIRLLNINWMTHCARLQWELSPMLAEGELDSVMALVHEFCFKELDLHRLEMRLCPGHDDHSQRLERLGYEYEGCLPAQLEFEGEFMDLAVYSILAES